MRDSIIDRKYADLMTVVSGYGDMALALSGGKDSVILLKAGVDALGPGRVVGMTAVSPIRRENERELAKELGRLLDVPVEFVHTEEYKDPVFIEKDTVERCFVCKTELFSTLRRVAERYGFENLVDGTNVDDSLEDRPVFEVQRRFGVKWPLVEAGITGGDVVAILKKLGLAKFAGPHYSCSAWEIDLRSTS
ncbi:MAG: adenine nucleotide alpha-hydrolase family protein [Candidatus Aquicultorales bacterium]